MTSPAPVSSAGSSSPAGGTRNNNAKLGLLWTLGLQIGHFRALTPDQEDAVRAAFAAGARPRDLAPAYSVSQRTIYRTLTRAGQRQIAEVRLATYRALFEVSDDGPVQLTEWVAA